MVSFENIQNQSDKFNNYREFQVNSNRIIADNSRKDIEKSFNIDVSKVIEAYYTDHNGLILRRIID